MNTTLTRRSVSAIARLDMSNLSHAQRIDAIAKAIGFETASALMGTLRLSEDDVDTSSNLALTKVENGNPVEYRAIIALGSSICSSLGNDEPIVDETGYIDGDLSVVSYSTPGELDAYLQGITDAEGWLDSMVIASELTDQHAFFDALDENPDLQFKDWYASQLKEDPLD